MSKTWLRRAVIVGAALYPALLIAIVLLLKGVGEAWWLTSVGLYLPRFVLAGPLLVLLPALAVMRARRLLAAQVISVLVLLFPLLGLVLPRWRGAASGNSLRLLTYNVNSCVAGPQVIADRIAEWHPDVVLLQELFTGSEPIAEILRGRYPVVQGTGQFLIASRFPIRAETAAPDVVYEDKSRSPHAVRYELMTPEGPLVVYNVHPLSPRHVIKSVRRRQFSSESPSGGASAVNRVNVDIRERHLAAAAEMARSEHLPLVIAGDTNLPGLSPLLERLFGNYQDAFEAAGWGFGYTYPRRLPWMRIDRVMSNEKVAFTGFELGCGEASDHRCVIADLRLTP